jgi:hypothetical protein
MKREEIREIVIKAVAGTMDLTESIDELLALSNKQHCEACNDVHDVKVICDDCITDICNNRIR